MGSNWKDWEHWNDAFPEYDPMNFTRPDHSVGSLGYKAGKGLAVAGATSGNIPGILGVVAIGGAALLLRRCLLCSIGLGAVGVPLLVIGGLWSLFSGGGNRYNLPTR